jgi:hypothetical protein
VKLNQIIEPNVEPQDATLTTMFAAGDTVDASQSPMQCLEGYTDQGIAQTIDGLPGVGQPSQAAAPRAGPASGHEHRGAGVTRLSARCSESDRHNWVRIEDHEGAATWVFFPTVTNSMVGQGRARVQSRSPAAGALNGIRTRVPTSPHAFASESARGVLSQRVAGRDCDPGDRRTVRVLLANRI